MPRELVTHYQRQRLLEGMVAAVSEKGYADTSVADVLERAGVSRTTFYELFDDKLSCFLAAHETVVEELLNEVRAACDQDARWLDRARGALGRLLERLASEPALGRVGLVEITTAGPAGKRRYRAALQRFAHHVDEGLGQSELDLPSPNPERVAVGAVAAILLAEVKTGREKGLPGRLPEILFAFLVPLVGPEIASRQRALADRGLVQPDM